ncbi:MAG: BMP family ABC transporter substrate-binding protein [Acidimicrobiaceae bacterium]|nr:BMP family ABC transporter substrate-binding protein [Acidimicrobiia bacterium]MCY4495017.1 BMP family ABC transporter substrate-binding protein [Acidimicrobiaceae bacterium]
MRRPLLLLSIFLSFTLIAASCGDDEETPLHVGLVFDIGGEGDQSFNDSAAAGLARAEETFDITTTKVSPNDDGSNRAELLQLQADNSDLVLAIGFLFADDAAAVGGGNPDTNFAVVDDSMTDFDQDPPAPRGQNIAGLVFSEEQGSFLVGAAAALSSETGTIGFIGGVCCFGLIEKFEAGFRAGALHINPEIDIISNYITEFPDFDGFNAPDRGRETALAIFEEGADVIYHAAGGTGAGLFAAAKEHSETTGSKVWGIGVDSDQYHTVDADVQEYVLTSMLKRVDAAVFEIIKAHLEGTFGPGETRYDLSVDGVGYSTSGGFLSDDIVDQLEDFKAQIIDGSIVVPTDPTEVGA